jgi:hypothetical protein
LDGLTGVSHFGHKMYWYSCATLIGTPCVLPLEGPIIWKVPLTEKALFYVINVPAKTSVWPKPGPVIWKVPISKVSITVARLYVHFGQSQRGSG